MNSSSTSSSLAPIPTNRQNTSKHPGHCFSKLLHLRTFKNCYSTHWTHPNRPQQAKKPHKTHSQSLLDLFLRPSFYSLRLDHFPAVVQHPKWTPEERQEIGNIVSYYENEYSPDVFPIILSSDNQPSKWLVFCWITEQIPPSGTRLVNSTGNPS